MLHLREGNRLLCGIGLEMASAQRSKGKTRVLMALKGIRLPGFKFDKKGRLIRDAKRLPVNKQIAQRKSKKIRCVKPNSRNPSS